MKSNLRQRIQAYEKIIFSRSIWSKHCVASSPDCNWNFLVIHGKEVFDAAKMQEYAKWDSFKSSSIMPYLGKGAEFAAGILMILGFCTRLASLVMIGTFAYITFCVGNGKFWMDDQHPFMFVLFGVLFFFMGPGAMSMDGIIFKRK